MSLIRGARVRQEGFSLVGVLVVMGVASVIAVSTTGLMNQLSRNSSSASAKSQFNAIVSTIQSYLNNASVCLSIFQTINIPYSELPTANSNNLSASIGKDITPFGAPTATPSIPVVFNLTSLFVPGGTAPLIDPTTHKPVRGLQKGTNLSINSFNLVSMTYLSPNVYQANLQLLAQNYQGSNLTGPVLSQPFTVLLSYDSNNNLAACNASMGVTNQGGYSNIATPTSVGHPTSGVSKTAGLGTDAASFTLSVYGNVGVQSSATQPGNFTMYGPTSSSTSGGVLTITASPPKTASNESSWIQEATADGGTASSTVIDPYSITTGTITGTSLTINNSGPISTGGAISGGSLTVTGNMVAPSLTATTNPGDTTGGTINGDSLILVGGSNGASITGPLTVTGGAKAASMTATGAITGTSLSIGTTQSDGSLTTNASNTIVGVALNIGVTGAALSSAPVYIGAGNSTTRFDTIVTYTPTPTTTPSPSPSPYPSVTTTPTLYKQAEWPVNLQACYNNAVCNGDLQTGMWDNEGDWMVTVATCITSIPSGYGSVSDAELSVDSISDISFTLSPLVSNGRYCWGGPRPGCKAVDKTTDMCKNFVRDCRSAAFGSSATQVTNPFPGPPVITAPNPATTMVMVPVPYTTPPYLIENTNGNCNNYAVGGQSGSALGKCIGSDSFSIEATGAIIAASFYANSDERFKTEIVDYENNLSVIEALSVKSYRYRDFREKGNKQKIGFIAQEVQKVLPEAVQSTPGVVPSIYALATQLSYQAQDKELFITLEKPHLLKKNNGVKLIDEQNKEKLCAVHRALSSKKFSVRGCWDQKPEQVFVWGKAVDDMLTLNYEAIFSVGIGAIQELKKEKDTEIQALQKTISEFKTAQDPEVEFFKKTVLELKKELTFIKKVKLIE